MLEVQVEKCLCIIWFLIQEIIAEKDRDAGNIQQTVDTGEKLLPDTAPEGRETIKQEIR